LLPPYPQKIWMLSLVTFSFSKVIMLSLFQNSKFICLYFVTEIVSKEYTEIKRHRHPETPLTMKDMYEVMRNKVVSYRSKNRHLKK
jgi:hypothetical protein